MLVLHVTVPPACNLPEPAASQHAALCMLAKYNHTDILLVGITRTRASNRLTMYASCCLLSQMHVGCEACAAVAEYQELGRWVCDNAKRMRMHISYKPTALLPSGPSATKLPWLCSCLSCCGNLRLLLGTEAPYTMPIGILLSFLLLHIDILSHVLQDVCPKVLTSNRENSLFDMRHHKVRYIPNTVSKQT